MLNLLVILEDGPNGRERQYSLPCEKECNLMEAEEFKFQFQRHLIYGFNNIRSTAFTRVMLAEDGSQGPLLVPMNERGKQKSRQERQGPTKGAEWEERMNLQSNSQWNMELLLLSSRTDSVITADLAIPILLNI
ncbi:hypothetical protein BTVI_87427 [Pitangus sulphuratus]|nr:hypothetical protein BTVI_87427 [Pitangus sulphuratus]